ncbi:MAG: thiol reductant ABC exporter subunit CydD [Actinobacteria bacterium]|nr:thiol reductant ABC exporter subunit CydD [Actinomycetota bacterium]
MRPLDPRLVHHARAARTHVVACVLLGLATSALVVAQAELLSRGIAGVVADRMRSGASTSVFVGLALVVVARAAVAWAQDVESARSAAAAKSELRRRVLEHAAERGTGLDDVGGRAEVALLATRGMDALDAYFARYLPQLVLAALVPMVVVVRLAAIDLTAAVTIVLTLPLIPVFMVLVGLATESANARRWHALERLSHHFLDVVSGLPTLKVFGRAKAQAAAVRESTDRYRTTTMATLRVAFVSSLVLELIATLSVALVAVSVGLRLVDGDLDLQTGLLIISQAPEAYVPLRRVGAEYHAAAEGLGAADRAFTFLETPVAANGASTDVPLLGPGCGIRVQHLGITHPGRVGAAPDDVSFVAPWGRVTVISGPSGSGKSSLLGVLIGAVQPTRGRVDVSGGGRQVDLTSLDRAVWRQHLAWVDQRPYLFAGTVGDNVRLARPDAADGEVAEAMRGAGLAAMPIHRQVGESGAQLSAGEQRRVAIARALLRGADVLLLDEPTAGLDEATETEVLDTIRRVALNCVVVMATHRPAAIAIGDTVVPLRATVPA